MAKYTKGYFSEEDLCTDSKQAEWGLSDALASRETRTKTTMRCYHISRRAAKIEMLITPKADRDEEKLAHTPCLVEMQHGTATLGNSLPDSLKSESGLASLCIPGSLSQRRKDLFLHRNLYTHVHSSFICNNPKLETTQMSLKR